MAKNGMMHHGFCTQQIRVLARSRSRGWVRPDLLRIISVLALAASIALVAILSPALHRLLSNKVQGAPTNFKYWTLGVRQTQGVHYHFDSSAIEKLSQIDSGQIRIAAHVISAPEDINAGRVHAAAHVEFYVGDYFQALHLPVRWMRTLGAGAEHSRPSGIVITSRLAQRLFGTDQHALGKPLSVHNPNTPYTIDTFVVGVLPKANRFHGVLGGPPASAWLDFRAYASLRGFKFRPPKTTDGITFKSNFQFDGVPVLVSAPSAITAPQLHVTLTNLWQAAVAQGAVGTGSGFAVYPGYTGDPTATTASRRRTRSVLFVAYAVLAVALLNFLFAILIRNVKDRRRHEMLHVLGQTSQMLFLDRLYAAFRTSLVLFACSICMVPLAFALQKRIVSFSGISAIDYEPWATSLGYGLALIGAVWALQILVEIASIRMLRSETFTPSIPARFAYQLVSTVEYMLATMLAIVAASAVSLLVTMSSTDLGIFGHPATIIGIAPRTLPGIGVPDTPSGNESAVSANNLALDAVYGAIRETVLTASAGAGPIPDVSQYYTPDMATLSAGGRRASICIHSVGPGWIEAASAHLMTGESIRRTDHADIIISVPSAASLFGIVSQSLGSSVLMRQGNTDKPYTVVGVISPFVVDASMTPCAVALTNVYGQVGNFSNNGGHFVVRPVVSDALVPVLKGRIDAALARADTKLRVETVESSDRLWWQLLAPYTLQSAIYLLVALTGALIAISGAFAQLLYAVAMRRQNNAIYSALGRKPSHIYRGLLMEFFAPIAIGMVAAVVVLTWLVARFGYISSMHVAVWSLPSFSALAILFLATVMVLHFPARRAARAEPAESLHEL